MKTLISLAVAAAFGITLSGCNTIAGAGRDVERGGQKIQDASVKTRVEWREWRARHDHDYDAARAACSSGSPADRDACRERARAEYRARLDEGRTQYRRAEFRPMTDRERMEAAYEAARDSCYTLRGADEDRCLAEARAKYRG